MSQSRNIFLAIAAAAAIAVLGPAGVGLVSSFTAWSAIGAGATIYTMLEARRLRPRGDQREAREVSLRSSEAPRRRVYGRARVGGLLAYWCTYGSQNEKLAMVFLLADHECDAVEEVLFDDKPVLAPVNGGDVGPGSPWYRDDVQLVTESQSAVAGVVTLSRQPLERPTVSLRLDDGSSFTVLQQSLDFTWGGGTTVNLTGQYAGQNISADNLTVSYKYNFGASYANVRKYLGTAGQAADPTLVSVSPNDEWDASCKLTGQTYIIVTLTWNDFQATSGIPNVSAILRGAKVLDTRTSNVAWTRNAPLCIRDYLAYAFKAAPAEINTTDLNDSANNADEDVAVEEGVVDRYTCDIVLYADKRRADNLEDMVLCMAGSVTWSGGQWRILSGKLRPPVTLPGGGAYVLGDGDVVGPVSIRTRLPKRELFNTVRGTFYDARGVDGAALYTRTNYTAYSSAAYIAEDGGEEISATIDFEGVSDYRAAHRIAKQIMHRARQAMRVTAPFSLKALPLQVGDVVSVNLTRYGVNGTFEVLERSFSFPSTVELVLQETTASVFDWAYTEVAFLDPSPNTMLAPPTRVERPTLTVWASAVAVGSNPATVDVLPDGSTSAYVLVSWPERQVAGEYVQVFWKRSFETAFRKVEARVGETSLKLIGPSGGDVLQIVGVAINAIGAKSEPWIVQEFVVDPNLPRFAGVIPALSANVLKNATLDESVAHWNRLGFNIAASLVSIARHPDPALRIAGSPSSAYIDINSSLSGNGYAGYVASAPFSVEPGQRWCGYALLSSFATSAAVWLRFYDGAGVQLSQASSQLVPARAFNAWADPLTYELAHVFAEAPAGARTGSLHISGEANWTGVRKYVSFHKPFAGVVPAGSTDIPVWSPGGQNAFTVTRYGTVPSALAVGAKGSATLLKHPVLAATELPAGALTVAVTGRCAVTAGTSGVAMAGTALYVSINGTELPAIEGGRSPASFGVGAGTEIDGPVLITFALPTFPGGSVAVSVAAVYYALDNTTAVLRDMRATIQVTG